MQGGPTERQVLQGLVEAKRIVFGTLTIHVQAGKVTHTTRTETERDLDRALMGRVA